MKFLDLGRKNYILASKVMMIIYPKIRGAKVMKMLAEEDGRYIDLTHGQKLRSIIITPEKFVIGSSVSPSTLVQRLEKATESELDISKEGIIYTNDDVQDKDLG